MTIIPDIRRIILPIVVFAAFCAGLGHTPLAQAIVVNQAFGSFRVPCVSDSVALECIGNHFERSQTSRGVGPQAASDSFVWDLAPGVHTGAIWSAQASAGRLRASTFGTLVVPAGNPASNFQMSVGQAGAFFQDDWTIRGPTDALRRLTLHFSLDGSVDDLAGIALPFGQVNGTGGRANGSLSVNIGTDSGSNRTLAPVAVGPSGGLLTQCIGLGGCGDPGFLSQSFELLFDVASGNLLSIFSDLFVSSSGSAYADFFNTAKLDYVMAPDDIDIIAASGDLFRQGDRFVYRANADVEPPPVSTVPEPDSLVLLALGVALIGAVRQRCWFVRGGVMPTCGNSPGST